MRKILKLSVMALSSAMVGGVLVGVSSKGAVEHAVGVNAEYTPTIVDKVIDASGNLESNDAIVIAQQGNDTAKANGRVSFSICLRNNNEFVDCPLTNKTPLNERQVGGRTDQLTDEQVDTELTDADLYARIAALNFTKGYILVDGHPVVGTANSSDAGDYNYCFNGTMGRVNMGTNSAGNYVLNLDMILKGITNDGGVHVITLKKGIQLPTWAYMTHKDSSKYTKDDVLVLNKTYTYRLATNPLKRLWVGTSAAEPVCVDTMYCLENTKANAWDVTPGNTTDGRFSFAMDLPSRAAIKGKNKFDGNNTGSQIHFDPYEEASSECRKLGGLLSLNFWDKIKVNGQPGKQVRTDSRTNFDRNGLDAAHAAFAVDLQFGTSYSTNYKDVKITLEKGIQIPTAECFETDVLNYITTNETYSFNFKLKNDASNYDFVSMTIDEADANAEARFDECCEPTEVVGATISDNNVTSKNSLLIFKLTNYDNPYINESQDKDAAVGAFNFSQHLILSQEFNSNNIVDEKGNPISLADARTVVGYHGVGVCMNGLKADFEDGKTIVIKAGTRFPAVSTFSAVNVSASIEAEKYYTTTKDITLKWSTKDQRFIRQDIIKTVVPTAIKFAQNSGDTSMKFGVHLDGADYSSIRTANSFLRKTDSLWSQTLFDGVVINTNKWEGNSNDCRSTRVELFKSGDLVYTGTQMLGNFAAPGVSNVTLKAGTIFYSPMIADQNGGAIEIYRIDKDYTFVTTTNATTFERLDVLQENAYADLVAAYPVENYRTAEQEELALALEAAKTSINTKGTYADINAEVEAQKTILNTIKTDADLVAEELAAAKASAKAELGSYLKPSDYTMTAETVASLVAAGVKAIDECTVIGDVATVLAAAKAELDKVPTDQDFADSLIQSINALPEPALSNTYLNALQSVMNQAANLTTECAALVGETNLAKISAAFAGFKQLLIDDVDAVFTSLSSDDYTEAQLSAITNAITTNKPLIESAETIDAAMTAYQAALAPKEDIDYKIAYNYVMEVWTYFVDHIVDGYITFTLEDGPQIISYVETINGFNGNIWYYISRLQVTLNNQKMTIDQVINNYILPSYFAAVEEEVLRIEEIIDEIPVQITLESEDAILAAREELDGVTNAEVLSFLEDDGYVAKVEAAEEILARLQAEAALAAAKQAAIIELTNYFDLEDYREAERAILEQGIVTVTAAINDATSIDQVNSIVTTTKEDIDALKTAAEYEAEELAAAQVAAKDELDAYAAAKDASKYDEAGNAAIAAAVEAGKLAINEATSEEAVASALEAAKAAIDAVEEYVAPQPEPKKGCGSSVVAASAIITLVSLLGAGLIATKRKEN